MKREQQLLELNLNLQMLIAEIERLKSVIELKDQSFAQLEAMLQAKQEQLHFLSDEIDRYEEEKQQLVQELTIVKGKYVDYNQLYKKYIDNMANQVILAVEVDCLRHKVSLYDRDQDLTRKSTLQSVRQSVMGNK